MGDVGPTRNKKMCGIIGYIGPKDVVPVLIDGLRRLEYRGYDSAGVAVVRDGAVNLRRSAGKLSNLEEVIGSDPITGEDRKSTRLNSSHEWISYAVFCLKKKKRTRRPALHARRRCMDRE